MAQSFRADYMIKLDTTFKFHETKFHRVVWALCTDVFILKKVKNIYERMVFNLYHLKYGFLIECNIPYAASAEFLN